MLIISMFMVFNSLFMPIISGFINQQFIIEKLTSHKKQGQFYVKYIMFNFATKGVST